MQASSLNLLEGKRIKAAASSLGNFVLEFDDGTGAVFEALLNNEEISLKASVCKSAELPKFDEAVCKVDWSWICGTSINKVLSGLQQIRFELSDVGPLSVSLGMWQGQPFLTFMPYKAPS